MPTFVLLPGARWPPSSALARPGSRNLSICCVHIAWLRGCGCELVSFRHEIGKLTQSLLNTEPSEHAAIVGSELRDHEATVPASCLGLDPASWAALGFRLSSELHSASFCAIMRPLLVLLETSEMEEIFLFYIILSHLSARFSNMKLTFLL